mmetsp:Transcript_27009/g.59536  ORF Transcript_27009/g.59536 Transcript_27009/m.59536 type:complete len:361 (+) Transcript_27009:1687-2769(+)
MPSVVVVVVVVAFLHRQVDLPGQVVPVVRPAPLEQNVPHESKRDPEAGDQQAPDHRDGLAVRLRLVGIDGRVDVDRVVEYVPALVAGPLKIGIVRDAGDAQKGRLVGVGERGSVVQVRDERGPVDQVVQNLNDVAKGNPVLVRGDCADVGSLHPCLVEVAVLRRGIPFQFAASAKQRYFPKIALPNDDFHQPRRSVHGQVETPDAPRDDRINPVVLGHFPQDHLLGLDQGQFLVAGGTAAQLERRLRGVVQGGPHVHVKDQIHRLDRVFFQDLPAGVSEQAAIVVVVQRFDDLVDVRLRDGLRYRCVVVGRHCVETDAVPCRAAICWVFCVGCWLDRPCQFDRSRIVIGKEERTDGWMDG